MEKQKKKQIWSKIGMNNATSEISKIVKNNATKQTGITLIALVISIIVMLILASVSLNMTVGENGIITQSQKAAFFTEMTQLQENVDMKRVSKLADDIEESDENPLFTDLVFTDFSKMPLTLAAEIMYTRNGMDAGVGKDADEIISEKKERIRVENFRAFTQNTNGLYYIDESTANGKEKTYIYDSTTRICYKIQETKYGGHTFHSLTWSDIVLNNSTKFVEDGLVMVAGLTKTQGTEGTVVAYEPDMTGFTSSSTYMIYYGLADEGGVADTKELLLSNYTVSDSESSSVRPITYEGYTLYNYAEHYWANVKCMGKNEKGVEMETWWTWIPRYAYKLDTTNKKADVKFVDASDNVITYDESGNAIQTPISEFTGYTVHEAFNQKGKKLKGIWVSKYPPSKNESSEKTIAPDLSNFAILNSETGLLDTTNTKNKVYVLAFDSSGKNYVEIPLYDYENSGATNYTSLFGSITETDYNVRTVKVVAGTGSVDAIGTNVTAGATIGGESGTDYYIYNYNKKIWANIKSVSNVADASGSYPTTYWVWIPRYAYYLDGQSTDVIFVDTLDNPVDNGQASILPSMYTVHEAFNQNGVALKGIWVSKYPANISGVYANNRVDSTVGSTAVPDLNYSTAIGTKASIKSALDNAVNGVDTNGITRNNNVTLTYYSYDGKRTSTTAFDVAKFKKTDGTYSIDATDASGNRNIPLTKTVSGETYYLYRFDMGCTFNISIINSTTGTSTAYTWTPTYTDTATNSVTIGSDKTVTLNVPYRSYTSGVGTWN